MGLEAAIPILGGLIGNLGSQSDERQAQKLKKKALDQIINIELPSMQDQVRQYEELQSAGLLTPELEQAQQQLESQMNKIQTDPMLKEAQMGALQSLQGLGEKGFTPQQELDLQKMQNNISQQNRGNIGAIQNRMASQGKMGSGFDLAMQMQAAQDAAARNQEGQLGIQAQAQKNALEGIMGAGQLGGQMRGQEFEEKSAQAQAQDAINRFNTSMRGDVGQRNVSSLNQAQAGNLANKQRIMDTNVGMRNQAQDVNKDLYQQNFDNQIRKGTAASNAYNKQATNYQQQAQDTRNMWAGFGSGAGNIYAGINQPKAVSAATGGY